VEEEDVSPLDTANAIIAQQADEMKGLQDQLDKLRPFVVGVSQQRPEKPDYWCSCGQCERNIEDARELVAK